MLMAEFLVYINNKLKIDDRFIFSDKVRLIEPCSRQDKGNEICIYMQIPF